MRRCSHIVPQQVGKGNPVGKKEMLAYAVLCIKKLKSWGDIAGSDAHNFRERETPNADAERTPDNATFAGNAAQDSVEAIKATITIGGIGFIEETTTKLYLQDLLKNVA